MKKIACLWVICAVAVMGGGCASVGYFRDRALDAADVFTLTVGMGLGVKARVGPVRTGLLLFQCDAVGFRGAMPVLNPPAFFDTGDYNGDRFLPPPFAHLFGWADSRWKSYEEELWYVGLNRGKDIKIFTVSGLDYPFHLFLADPLEAGPAYYTQIEVVVGLIPSVRAGFNPGELLDFFLGWFGVDIYDDDLSPRIRKVKRLVQEQWGSIEGNWQLIEPGQLSSEKFPILSQSNGWRFKLDIPLGYTGDSPSGTVRPFRSYKESTTHRREGTGFRLSPGNKVKFSQMIRSYKTSRATDLEERYTWSVEGDILTLESFNPLTIGPGVTTGKKIRLKRISR